MAGLHLSLLFEDRRLDTRAAARRALAAGVGVQPLHGYFRRRPRAGLALGYGVIAVERIPEGLARLASCLEPGPGQGSSRGWRRGHATGYD